MKTKIGIIFGVIGTVLLVSALCLFAYNFHEEKQAGASVNELMPQIIEAIRDGAEKDDNSVLTQDTMPVITIDGNDYMGFVGIPSINRELPVMADWSYPKLKTSPCRFSGDIKSNDMVIMAHNYDSHFGAISNLREGDSVTFTDMNGITQEYEVVALDVLSSLAVEEMSAGNYDLTLFTCTYGGESRVTVRCDKIKD